MTSSNLDAMKRIFCLLTLLAAFAACGSAFAQRLQNGSYSTVGYIKSDGTIQDGSYRTIGYIKSDGTVQDGSYRTVGHIKGDGTVQDGSYRTIGHVKSDGTVQDGSYRTVGHADASLRKEWIAWFYFFK